MRVEVTAQDIARGIRADAGSCPIALALRRMLPSDLYVHVDGATAMIESDSDRLLDAELPDDAKQFTSDFDTGEPVEPFAFDLLVDDEDRAHWSAGCRRSRSAGAGWTRR